MKNQFGVKVGQIWKDNDSRFSENEQRELEVLSIDDVYAICKNIKSGKTSKIKLNRFKANSTGYRLIKES
jgi:hypothetical protein